MKVRFIIAVTLFFAIGYVVCFVCKSITLTEAERFARANVEALATPDSGDGSYYSESIICYNGGPGATSCSIDGGIDIVGSGVSVACSVSCGDGYYACCGIRCVCNICDL